MRLRRVAKRLALGVQGSKAQTLSPFIVAGTGPLCTFAIWTGLAQLAPAVAKPAISCSPASPSPIWHWRDADQEVSQALAKYGLADDELHTAWMLRKYLEQPRIPGFEQLGPTDRRHAVYRHRTLQLARLGGPNDDARRQRTRKLHRKTEPYVHLTWQERRQAVLDVAETVANWGFARLFAECVDKSHFDPARSPRSIDGQAFEQVVSRFERFLKNVSSPAPGHQRNHGMLVHDDNNDAVSRKHTQMMRSFHADGTLWTSLDCIVETPMLVNPERTRMIQIANLCAYALRRYLENNETQLFEPIFSRADRIGETTVGVRHFSPPGCNCAVCEGHEP